MLAALAHAHARGVVHRDVKPANILLGPDGRARLSDFGVARLSGESRLTLTGGVVGTVAYMAPEQARGEGAGPASDVYSACLVVYEALAGANPVAGGSPAETARRAAAGAVPPLARARPGPAQAASARRSTPASRATRRPGPAAARDGRPPGRGARRARRPRPGGAARAPCPVLASAAGGAALAAAGLAAADGQLAQHLLGRLAAPRRGRGRHRPLRARLRLAAARGRGPGGRGRVRPGGPRLARPPRRSSGPSRWPSSATGWRTGRLLLLPAAAPALFALGLGPLYPAIAGLVPRWPARLWAAVAGDGRGPGLAGRPRGPAGCWRAARPCRRPSAGWTTGSSPAAAGRALWEPLADRPEALVQAAALVAAAMCVPLVLRARPGGPRAGGLRRLGGGRGGRAGRDRPGRPPTPSARWCRPR